MMEDSQLTFSAGMGGPGADDRANGAAALTSALYHAARTLAQTGSSIRGSGIESDVVGQAISSATMRASLALAIAEAISETNETMMQAWLIAAAARKLGVPLPGAIAMLRGAALMLPTDDASARIAASMQVSQLAALLTPRS
ncbi:hypothetical protein IAI18_17705 [Acetobacteraceae bacterium H6797]|nr:hypothetical protein [Acetobacteraceae bacterium H6797]